MNVENKAKTESEKRDEDEENGKEVGAYKQDFWRGLLFNIYWPIGHSHNSQQTENPSFFFWCLDQKPLGIKFNLHFSKGQIWERRFGACRGLRFPKSKWDPLWFSFCVRLTNRPFSSHAGNGHLPRLLFLSFLSLTFPFCLYFWICN